MSLADAIYESNYGGGIEHPLDELGLAIWDNIEYYVARAIAVSHRDRPDEFSIYQLHMEGEQIFNGHKEVKESYENINVLTETTKRFNVGEKAMFWKILKQCLPVLDKNYIQISDNLLWDKTNGEVINIKEEYERQRTQKYQSSEENGKRGSESRVSEGEME